MGGERMHSKATHMYPWYKWTTRTMWTQWNKDENQNKELVLFPQMTVYLFILSIMLSLLSFRLSRECLNRSKKDIQSHNILWQDHIRPQEKKSLLSTYCFCTDKFDNHCDQVWNHKCSPSPSECSLIAPHTQVDQLWCRLVLMIKREKKKSMKHMITS
jgi:hypothetical protein